MRESYYVSSYRVTDKRLANERGWLRKVLDRMLGNVYVKRWHYTLELYPLHGTRGLCLDDTILIKGVGNAKVMEMNASHITVSTRDAVENDLPSHGDGNWVMMVISRAVAEQ